MLLVANVSGVNRNATGFAALSWHSLSLFVDQQHRPAGINVMPWKVVCDKGHDTRRCLTATWHSWARTLRPTAAPCARPLCSLCRKPSCTAR